MKRVSFACLQIVLVMAIALVCIEVSDKLAGQPQPPKFPVSDYERVKQENIQLKQTIVNIGRQLNDCQAQVSQISVAQEMKQYEADTLKAHGNPAGVTFDPGTMQWKVEEPKKPLAPAEKK